MFQTPSHVVMWRIFYDIDVSLSLCLVHEALQVRGVQPIQFHTIDCKAAHFTPECSKHTDTYTLLDLCSRANEMDLELDCGALWFSYIDSALRVHVIHVNASEAIPLKYHNILGVLNKLDRDRMS